MPSTSLLTDTLKKLKIGDGSTPDEQDHVMIPLPAPVGNAENGEAVLSLGGWIARFTST